MSYSKGWILAYAVVLFLSQSRTAFSVQGAIDEPAPDSASSSYDASEDYADRGNHNPDVDYDGVESKRMGELVIQPSVFKGDRRPGILHEPIYDQDIAQSQGDASEAQPSAEPPRQE
jgi:hypothetical protein